jgi:hypothetical protein
MKKITLNQENPKSLWQYGRYNYFAERLLSFIYGQHEHVPQEFRVEGIEFLSVGRFPRKVLHIIPEDPELKVGDQIEFHIKPKTKSIPVTPGIEVVAIESLKVVKNNLEHKNCFQLLLEQEGHPLGQIRHTAGRVTHMDQDVKRLMENYGVPIKEVFYEELVKISKGGNYSIVYFETYEEPESGEEE